MYQKWKKSKAENIKSKRVYDVMNAIIQRHTSNLVIVVLTCKQDSQERGDSMAYILYICEFCVKEPKFQSLHESFTYDQVL